MSFLSIRYAYLEFSNMHSNVVTRFLRPADVIRVRTYHNDSSSILYKLFFLEFRVFCVLQGHAPTRYVFIYTWEWERAERKQYTRRKKYHWKNNDAYINITGKTNTHHPSCLHSDDAMTRPYAQRRSTKSSFYTRVRACVARPSNHYRWFFFHPIFGQLRLTLIHRRVPNCIVFFLYVVPFDRYLQLVHIYMALRVR